MAIVKQIYDAFDMELTDKAIALMEEHLEQARQAKHGKHSYSDEIGVSKEAIHERFATYMQALNVRAE
jgi:hypothetical protein